MNTTFNNCGPALHSSWVEHLSPGRNHQLRVFCFPYAGGSAQVFRTWQRFFPPQIEICPVQFPGRGRRIKEPPFTRIKALVKAIADAIFNGPPEPFVFYGHSMGAIISFELARELRRRRTVGPRHLFLSGRRAPTMPDSEGPTFNLPHDKFIAELRRLNGTPPELLELPEATELFLPLLRADFEIVDTYVYEDEEPLACPITVYGGLGDERVPRESLCDWQKQTTGGCRERMLPGDHFFIHNLQSEFFNVLPMDVLRVLQPLDVEGCPR
jgi:medium-chain acyl-[acyl-carrier-protein] hydrolase